MSDGVPRVPDEAVEAAADALAGKRLSSTANFQLTLAQAREALEAALPSLRACFAREAAERLRKIAELLRGDAVLPSEYQLGYLSAAKRIESEFSGVDR